MARQPEWFERLDAVLEVVRRTSEVAWFGRSEIQAVFGCSERDSVRLLHKFGAEDRDNRLSLPRSALLVQLDAIRSGSRYGAYLAARQGVAKRLTAARAEATARQFRVAQVAPDPPAASFERLPETIRWRRAPPGAVGRFEIEYRDGLDLMNQLAGFLAAAGVNREEFFLATEPARARE
jgi:hypothetical protein